MAEYGSGVTAISLFRYSSKAGLPRKAPRRSDSSASKAARRTCVPAAEAIGIKVTLCTWHGSGFLSMER